MFSVFVMAGWCQCSDGVCVCVCVCVCDSERRLRYMSNSEGPALSSGPMTLSSEWIQVQLYMCVYVCARECETVIRTARSDL